MKAVLIMHNVAIDAEVNEALKSIGIECYSKFTNALGKGNISDPHLDTDVWPGTNYGTFIVTEDKIAKKLMENVRQLRKKLGSEGIKAFMWSIEDMT
jgi:hypothetical protein